MTSSYNHFAPHRKYKLVATLPITLSTECKNILGAKNVFQWMGKTVSYSNLHTSNFLNKLRLICPK